MNNGRFQKGRSGNPGGRPRVLCELQELARQRTIEALDVLVQIMLNEEAAPGARIAAANALLDRGYGKAPQAITSTIDDKRDVTDWTTAELVAFLNDRSEGRRGRDSAE